MRGKVRFINRDRAALVEDSAGVVFYMKQPRIKLQRTIRQWARVLCGWAKSRLGWKFIRVVLSYLDTAGILSSVKRLICAIVPAKFALTISVGQLLQFNIGWAA